MICLLFFLALVWLVLIGLRTLSITIAVQISARAACAITARWVERLIPDVALLMKNSSCKFVHFKRVGVEAVEHASLLEPLDKPSPRDLVESARRQRVDGVVR